MRRAAAASAGLPSTSPSATTSVSAAEDDLVFGRGQGHRARLGQRHAQRADERVVQQVGGFVEVRRRSPPRQTRADPTSAWRRGDADARTSRTVRIARPARLPPPGPGRSPRRRCGDGRPSARRCPRRRRRLTPAAALHALRRTTPRCGPCRRRRSARCWSGPSPGRSSSPGMRASPSASRRARRWSSARRSTPSRRAIRPAAASTPAWRMPPPTILR